MPKTNIGWWKIHNPIPYNGTKQISPATGSDNQLAFAKRVAFDNTDSNCEAKAEIDEYRAIAARFHDDRKKRGQHRVQELVHEVAVNNDSKGEKYVFFQPLVYMNMAQWQEQDIWLVEKVRAMYHVAEGIEALHRVQILHGDIKLRNLGVTFEAVSTRSGFILDCEAARIGKETWNGEDRTTGTASYLAPERVAAHGHCGLRSDIFSLGVSLFELYKGGGAPWIDEAGREDPFDKRGNVKESHQIARSRMRKRFRIEREELKIEALGPSNKPRRMLARLILQHPQMPGVLVGSLRVSFPCSNRPGRTWKVDHDRRAPREHMEQWFSRGW